MNDIWEKYATVLVDYSTNVQKGDLVIIKASSPMAENLVKAVYKRVLEKGANPILRTSICDLTDTFIKYASDEQLDFVDPISKLEYEKVDKYISIGAPLNVKNMARADKTKLARRSKATRELSELLLNRSAKGEASWVIADVPTHGLAQEARMSIDEYTEFLINACYLDLDNPVEKLLEVDKEQRRLCDYLNKVKKVRYVGEKTDVTFSTEGRKWMSCSGKHNYPDGEIYTSPVEDSANGEIYFDFPAIYRGNEAHKIHIKLENGKVVSATAEKGEEFLNAMLDMDEGSRFVGEIAIGTNERIQDVTGSILFDEKIGGSIHVAFGASYPETGGKNVSGLHWDIIKNMKNGGEIYADDVLVYKDGKFLI
jgi:aminopeptidase